MGHGHARDKELMALKRELGRVNKALLEFTHIFTTNEGTVTNHGANGSIGFILDGQILLIKDQET